MGLFNARAESRPFDADGVGDILILQAIALQEVDHGTRVPLDAVVEFRGVVAQLLELQGPGGLISLDFLLRESLGRDGTVHLLEFHDTLFDGSSAEEEADGEY